MNILFKTLLTAAFFLMAATIFVQSLIQYQGNQSREIPESPKVVAAAMPLPKAFKLDDLVTVNVKETSNYVSEGKITTTEQLDYSITARVVDIRPDGRLVLEARKTMRVDDEIIENSLIGIARPEDFSPNNTVLSEKLAELRLNVCTRSVVKKRQSFYDTAYSILDAHISNVISAFNLLACKSD